MILVLQFVKSCEISAPVHLLECWMCSASVVHCVILVLIFVRENFNFLSRIRCISAQSINHTQEISTWFVVCFGLVLFGISWFSPYSSGLFRWQSSDVKDIAHTNKAMKCTSTYVLTIIFLYASRRVYMEPQRWHVCDDMLFPYVWKWLHIASFAQHFQYPTRFVSG